AALHTFPTRRSSDLRGAKVSGRAVRQPASPLTNISASKRQCIRLMIRDACVPSAGPAFERIASEITTSGIRWYFARADVGQRARSEEHTSELQSLAY